MNFPSDEAIQYGYVAGGYRAPIRATLEAAYAIDEPKIRADQTRKIVETLLHEAADRGLRGDKDGALRFSATADFIERELV